MNGIFLWCTGLPDLAEKLDFSRLSDLPAMWSEDIDSREPWREAALFPEGPASHCRVSERRIDKPVIFIAGACSSVMPLAWHFVDIGCLPEWGSIISICQSRGRGQLGRDWVSPPGNLYTAIRLPKAPQNFSGILSLLIGYAVIRVLQELGLPASLKWPNDVMIGGKKAGGILIQNRLDISVAGIGLNLASAPDESSLRAAHAVPATHLAAAGHQVTPLPLLERLVDRSSFFMEEILGVDISSAISRIQAQMSFIHQTVRVDDHSGNIYNATFLGLSEDGGLLLGAGNETKTIRSGSISPLPDLQKE